MSLPPVKVYYEHNHVIIDNGLLKLTLSNPQGCSGGIQYKGIDNLLERFPNESRRGYLALDWNPGDGHGTFDTIEGAHFEVILESLQQVELSFKRSCEPSLEGKYAPLIIDLRFIVLRGSSGFYSYAIVDKFGYMAIADNRQRYMPLPDDLDDHRSHKLAYGEARLLVNTAEPEFKGEVDDKYIYSSKIQRSKHAGP